MKSFISSTGRSITCLPLKGRENYSVWAFAVRRHLVTLGFEKRVLEQNVKAEKLEEEEQKTESEAFSFLLSIMNETEIAKVQHCTLACQIWKHLETQYGKKTTNAKLELMSELSNIKVKTASEISDAIGSALVIKGKLQELNIAVDDSLILSALIKALPSCFATFLEGWQLLDVEAQTLDRFVNKIQERAKLIAANEESAMLAHDQSKSRNAYRGRGGYRHQYNRGNGINHGSKYSNSAPLPAAQASICNYCHHPGHWKAQCRKLQFANRERGTTRYQTINNQTQRPTWQQRAHTSGTIKGEEFVCMAVDEDMELAGKWIVDSGATAHMSADLGAFSTYKQFQTPTQIRLGDGSTLLALGAGSIKSQQCTLGRVLYVPGMKSNLFSASAATDQGVEFQIKGDSCLMLKDGHSFATATRQGGLYQMDLDVIIPEEAANTAASLDVWHQRFTHCPRPLIKKMMENDAVVGLRINNGEDDSCTDCKINKCTRSSHNQRQTPKTTKPGVSLHADLMGPITPEGIDGEKYILVVRDEYSHLRFVSCLKSKSQVTTKLMTLINRVEYDTSNNVLRLTSDNGTEFLSDKFRAFLDSKGIEHIKSAPYVPQQNGVVERENRTLLGQARTTLNASKLPHFLWPQVVNAVTYASNRMITRRLQITPFELFYGRKPNVNNLRIFGQHACVLKPDAQKGKFDMKGKIMNFVGYTENFQNYLFFDPDKRVIVVACDAAFMRKVGPISREDLPNEVEQGEEPEQVVSFNFTLDADDHLVSSPEDPPTADEINTEEQVGQPDDKQLDSPLDSEASKSGDMSQYFSTENLNKTTDSSSSGDTTLKDKDEQSRNPRDELPSREVTIHPQGTLKESTSRELGRKVTTGMRMAPKTGTVVDRSLPQGRLRRRTNVISYSDLAKGRLNLDRANVAKHDETPPSNFEEISTRSDASEWYRAIDSEIESLVKNDVFVLVDRPNCNVVGSRWVFTYKDVADGTRKTKARLVAQGYTQRRGVDYGETFAPVVHSDTIRLLLAIAAQSQLEIIQFDVRTAFLYGELQEDIFMRQPPGMDDGSDRVWRLKRSIYGLKQAPRVWNQKFSGAILALGFERSSTDPCVFMKNDPQVVLALYVDDALMLTQSKEEGLRYIKRLQEDFEITVIKTEKFLGLQYFKKDEYIYVHQIEYLDELLLRFGMHESNPCATPILPQSEDVTGQELDQGEHDMFREIVGCLNYLACQTRPDIAFTVGFLGRKVAKPTALDLQAAKRCLRYLNGSRLFGLKYGTKSTGMRAFSDASYADEVSHKSYRSTTGLVILFNESPIAWKSGIQKSVATSTAEAETMAISATIKKLIPLKNLVTELRLIGDTAIPLYSDNKGAVAISNDAMSAQRTRHMGAQLAFVRQENDRGTVRVQHVPAVEQIADFLTKPLAKQKFTANCLRLLTIIPILVGLLSGESAKATNIARIPSKLWVETDYRVEVGYRVDTALFRIRNHCASLDASYAHDKVESYRKLLQEALTRCRDYKHRMFDPTLKELQRITRGRPKRDLESLVKELPDKDDIGMSGTHVWLSRLTLGIYDTIYEHYAENSVKNTVRRHNEIIKQMMIMVLKHEKQLNSQVEMNRETREAIRTLTNATQSLNTEVSDTQWVPYVMNLLNREENMIISDVDHISKFMYNFDKGKVHAMALISLAHPRMPHPVYSWLRKGIRLIHIDVMENELNVTVRVPIEDPNSKVKQSVNFREWVDESSFKVHQGFPQYILHNKTINCTRPISKPIDDYTSMMCITQDLAKYPQDTYVVLKMGNQTEEVEPEIFRTNTSLYVQCYPGKLKIFDEETECPRWPFLIENQSTLEINGYQYKILKTTFSVAGHLDNLDNITLSPAIKYKTGAFRSIFENLNKMDKVDAEMKALAQFDLASLGEHMKDPSILSGILMLVGVLAGLLYWSSKRSSDQKTASNPSAVVNVNIGNTTNSPSAPDLYPWNLMEMKQIPNDARVQFDEVSMNSKLGRALHDAPRNIRPATPFASRLSSRCSSRLSFNENSASEWSIRERIRAITRPTRFPKLKHAVSTMSLPGMKIKSYVDRAREVVQPKLQKYMSTLSVSGLKLADYVGKMKTRLREAVEQ